MRGLITRLKNFCSFLPHRRQETKEKELYQFILKQLGRVPKSISLYTQAMTHRSCFHPPEGPRSMHVNERLEYLGDAVLDLCVGELLFKAYPSSEEGMLTNMRSKIVNTAHLAQVAEKLGLREFIRYKGDALSPNVIGSALEALIGAIYLDQGYGITKHFVQRRLLARYVSLEELRQEVFNYKGKIVEWAQKEKKSLQFDTTHLNKASTQQKFKATLFLDEEILAHAQARNKKEAQQLAAKIACHVLNLS